VGSCLDFDSRLSEHLSKKYAKSYTAKTIDWYPIIKIDQLKLSQARKIELHIKKMKSRLYFKNLIKYPEMIEKLKMKYQ